MVSTGLFRIGIPPLTRAAAVGWVRKARRVGAVVLLLGGVALTAVARNDPLRIGVLTAADLPVEHVGDLVTAALSSESGVELVERDLIDAVLRELELATALGADAAGARLKLGAMLHADLLVLLEPEHDTDVRYVRLVICDTKLGARLAQDRLTPDDGAEKLAAEVCERVRATRARLAAGITRIVAIPPFVSRSLTHDLDHLQRQLPHVLEEAFSALPGTAVLEVEEASAIRRELDLRGSGVQTPVVPWFVNGEYRLEGALGRPGARLTLTLVLTDGKDLQHESRQTCATVDELVSFVRTTAVTELVGSGAGAAPLTVEQQLARMEARATAFDRLGRSDLANEIREGCLLIAPDDATTLKHLIRSYAAQTGAWPRPAWYEQPSQQVRAAWATRPPLWRRGLELLEHLIRRDLITQYEAHTLLHTLERAIDKFVFSGPNDPVQPFEVQDPELLALFDRELAACTQVSRRFRAGLYPHIRELPAGAPDEEWEWRSHQPDPRGEWYVGLFKYPDYRRNPAGRIHMQITPELLTWYAGIVEREHSSAYGSPEPVVAALERFATAPPAERAATDADFTRFLAALEATQDPLDAACARLGRLLCAQYRVPAGERPDSMQASAEAISVEQEFRRITGDVPQVLLRLRRELAGQAAPTRTPTAWSEPRPPTMNLGATDPATYELGFERVQLNVRLRDGREQPFGEVTWAGQPGFVSEWCPPWSLERVGDQLDVLWSKCYVLAQREPGVLEPVVLDHSADVRCVRCDATSIWVASRDRGLQVFDWAGNLLQTIDQAAGLPPYDQQLTCVLLHPGQAVAAGSFGPQGRGWCARVDINTRPPTIDILLEATESDQVDEEQDEELVELLTPAERRARQVKRAFVPWRMDVYRDPCASGRAIAYVERQTLDERMLDPLLVDPEQRTVRVVRPVLAAHAVQWDHVASLFMPDGRVFFPCEEHIVLQAALGRVVRPQASERIVYEDLRVNHTVLEWADDGYLYAPSRGYWARIDPETMTADALGRRPQFQPQAGDAEYISSSAHFGLVMYTSAGKFFKVHVMPRPSAPPETPLPRVRALRVLEAATQAPLAQAQLDFDYQGLHATSRVDAAGLADIPAGMESAVVTALADGYEPGFVALRAGRHAGAEDGTLTMTLRPLLRLAGQVVDGRGEPAAEVHVRARLRESHDPLQQTLTETVTDARGAWALTLLPDDDRDFWLQFSAGPGAERVLDMNADELALLRAGRHVCCLRRPAPAGGPAPGVPDSMPASKLPPGVKTMLDVLVSDLDGKPVADAEVASADPALPQSSGAAQRASTDQNGRCQLPRRFPSAVVVHAAGYADHVEVTRFTQPPDGPCTIRLTPATPVTLRVVDPNDLSLPDVAVTAYCKSARTFFAKTGVTGPDGTLSWDCVPTGQIEWAATVAGKDLFVLETTAGDAGEWRVRVRPQRVVHVFGTVTDSATGAPVPEFKAGLYPPDAARGRPGTRAWPGQFVGGQFDLYPQEPNSAYDLRIEADGYMPQRIALAIPAEPELRQNVQLRTSVGLRVRVQRADGSPVEGIDVLGASHELRTAGYPLNKSWVDDELLPTDEHGIVVLAPRLGTRWVVAANADDLGIVTADENATEVTITLERWPVVAGNWERVPDGLPEVRLKLTPVFRDDERNRTSRLIEATVDADGSFEFTRVPPGDYWLFREVLIRESEHGGTLGQDRFTRITVKPGERLQLDVRAVGRPVIGRLVRADGSPVTGGELNGYLNRRPSAERPNWRDMSQGEREAWNHLHPSTIHLQFDSQGGFLAREVPPGTYRLQIMGHAPGADGMVSIHVQDVEVAVPELTAGEPPTRIEVGAVNVDAAQPRKQAAAQRTRLSEPPPELPDWPVLGLQAGAGLAVVAAAVLGVRRRLRNRAKCRAPGATPHLLVLGLVLACSARVSAQDNRSQPDTSPLLPVVRAVDAYKGDCGLWPQRLEDLVPTYIGSVPTGCTYEWSWTGYVHVACTSAGQQLVFVFNGDDRGWYAGRPGRFRALSVPPPAPTGSSRPRLELLQAARAEFERRIAREPKNPEHRQAEIAYLYAADELAEARQAALGWVAVDARAIAPRFALSDIERKERSGLDGRWGRTDVQDNVCDAWAKRMAGSYGRWRVFAQPGSDGRASTNLARVLQGPLYQDRTEWLYAELFLNEDAAYLSDSDHADGLLALCAKWESTAQDVTDPPPDHSFYMFRTVAHLKRQEYDAAAADYDLALAAFKAGRSWQDPRSLESAVRERRDLPGFLDRAELDENDWRMKLNCPLPER